MSNIFQTSLNQQYFSLITLKIVLERVPQKDPEWWWQLQILQLQFPWNFKGVCQINFKQGWIRNVFYRWYKKWPQNWDHKMVPKKVPESIVAILDSRASLAQQVGSKIKKKLCWLVTKVISPRRKKQGWKYNSFWYLIFYFQNFKQKTHFSYEIRENMYTIHALD